MLIDGKALAAKMREEIKSGVAKFKNSRGRSVGLAVVLVGENPASQVYVRNKIKACEETGIKSFAYYLPESVSQAQLEEYVLKPDATEGLVDFALTVDGVEVSVCLLEMKRGQYKASFRSRSVDVNDVAAVFGGGGHVLASGCMLFGDLEEVVDRVRYAVYQRL